MLSRHPSFVLAEGRTVWIDGVSALVFVVPKGEADHNFVAPVPNPVVGRPSGEAAGLVIDFHVPLDVQPLLASGGSHCNEGEARAK